MPYQWSTTRRVKINRSNCKHGKEKEAVTHVAVFFWNNQKLLAQGRKKNVAIEMEEGEVSSLGEGVSSAP